MSETQHIDAYLNKSLLPADHLLMEAKLILDPELREKTLWQQRTYELVKAYGRKRLREDIERAQTRVFTEQGFSAFRKIIHHLFK
jgi:hypothetical protein